MTEKTAIIVFGVHRAGTSLITRSLDALGVDLGDHLMPGSKDNPLGYFEDVRAVDTNETILRKLGRRWTDIAPLQMPREITPDWHGEIETIDAIIKSFQGNEFAIKDPRLSLTFKIWQDRILDAGMQVKTIICVRRPSEVARSLNKRDLTPTPKGELIWFFYMISAIYNAPRGNSLFVSYETMLTSPANEVQRIANWLGADADFRTGSKPQDFVSNFIKPELRRERDRSLEHTPMAVTELYDILMEAASKDADALDSVVKAAEPLKSWFDGIGGLRSFADSVERMFTEKSAEYEALKARTGL